jgi:hypothetical protein
LVETVSTLRPSSRSLGHFNALNALRNEVGVFEVARTSGRQLKDDSGIRRQSATRLGQGMEWAFE